jgi:hypothetical protein
MSPKKTIKYATGGALLGGTLNRLKDIIIVTAHQVSQILGGKDNDDKCGLL